MGYNHGEWVLIMKYDLVGVISRDNVRDEITRRGDSGGVSKKTDARVLRSSFNT